jgi:hypothetical protein
MIFYIKNMVCIRCQMVVKFELEKLGLICTKVGPGRVDVSLPIPEDKLHRFKLALIDAGLDLLTDKKSILVEKIKNVITEMLNYPDDTTKINFSYYLSKKLDHDYTYLANLFSENEGITIEHFLIANRIQRAKRLICDDELNLTEISWKLHYASVAHLSTQFKKITGVTPSFFKHNACNGALHQEMCEL